MTEFSVTDLSVTGTVPSVRAFARPASRVAAPPVPPKRRFALWRWLPTEIAQRGGRVSRDDERAYRDLQAARDRSEW